MPVVRVIVMNVLIVIVSAVPAVIFVVEAFMAIATIIEDRDVFPFVVMVRASHEITSGHDHRGGPPGL